MLIQKVMIFDNSNLDRSHQLKGSSIIFQRFADTKAFSLSVQTQKAMLYKVNKPSVHENAGALLSARKCMVL